MNRDRLHEIIVENVEKLLNEKYSISDDVVAMTTHYWGVINKMINLGEFQNSAKLVIGINGDNGDDRFVTRISYKILSIDVDYKSNEAFNSLNRIIIKIYDFPSRDVLQMYYEDCEIGGTSGVYNGIITVNGFSINGKINLPSVKITLQHEFEHLLQIGYGKNVNNNERLKIANNNLSLNKESCGYIIARLFYFFSQEEIDAKMHELYFDIRKQQISSPVYLKKCFAIKEKGKYLELLNKLLVEFSDDAINYELSKYKENKNSFLKYIDKQIRYFDRKTWRVMMQYFDELENVKLRKRIREE